MTILETQYIKKDPIVHESAYVANGVQMMGDVELGENVSIWYNSVLRGDAAPIKVGNRSNIQDGSIIHVDSKMPTIIGEDVTVGHNVNLHGCIIEDGALIGMGAIVLSGAVVKKGAVVAAGAVVRENAIIEPNTLYAGVPAKKIKELDASIYDHNVDHANVYIGYAKLHKDRFGSIH